jgi:D-lactate dehydrogenase
MLTGIYTDLRAVLQTRIPVHRLIHDDLRTLAYGTDAGFYRLVPKLVVKVETIDEVVFTVTECHRRKIPVTFRAAGTSLSGQAISDSVLIMLGHTWKDYSILDNGNRIRLQPGIIGGHANIFLAPYGRKIGPDPASINAAMIGGIAANNASGMCCGVAENSYKTLHGMTVVFADGSVLDTDDEESRHTFRRTHHAMLDQLTDLAKRVKANEELAGRIRRKYKMKNTTGYSLNALVDFDDPVDILQHLMIGSEGTLGFMADITYNTVIEHPHKASALIFFPDVRAACKAVTILKAQHVSAVELMDRAALRSVENKQGMPPFLKGLGENVACLLVETRAGDRRTLEKQIGEVTESIASIDKVRPVEFTDDPVEYTKYWNIRKGLFPALGIMRQVGTTVIIEDVAFPVGSLAEATLELQRLFVKHGYHEAIIFGHALEGNLHFVFNQDFNSREEVARYQYFMNDVARMVVHTYDGALKAEHGTGRNMAPYVELEWGAEAYEIMKEIKNIFDPENILNPGVILNDDKLIHVKNLKPMPEAHELIDKCIECGYCEVHCPSKDLTLTPRQRIVAWREITRLSRTAEDPERLRTMRRLYTYQGEDTCAVDGLCETSCPVDIDTGKLIKELRAADVSPTADSIASMIAHNFGGTVGLMRFGMNIADAMHGLIGTSAMDFITTSARKLSGNRLPQWNRYIPRAADAIRMQNGGNTGDRSVVYVPSCVSRLMGVARGSGEKASQLSVTDSLLRKGGFDVIYPANLKRLCCGLAFSSKGYRKQGDEKAREMEAELMRVSDNGRIPILMDTSPCVQRMVELFDPVLRIYDPSVFVLDYLVHYLEFRKVADTITVHIPCSSRKLGLDAQLIAVARLCAENVIVPPFVGCCGFAGDRGFSYPELTLSALNRLKQSLADSCTEGYSTSRGCEIGLSMSSGLHYKSLLYLVDRATGPK